MIKTSNFIVQIFLHFRKTCETCFLNLFYKNILMESNFSLISAFEYLIVRRWFYIVIIYHLLRRFIFTIEKSKSHIIQNIIAIYFHIAIWIFSHNFWLSFHWVIQNVWTNYLWFYYENIILWNFLQKNSWQKWKPSN